MTKGYYQIKMAEEDIVKTGFVTPDGCYVFQRMPFGLVNLAATYNKMMQKMLSDLKCADSYIDDIIIHTETWEEHMDILEELFKRIKSTNLTVPPTKCKFSSTKVDFLGHHVGEGEIGLYMRIALKRSKLQNHRRRSMKSGHSWVSQDTTATTYPSMLQLLLYWEILLKKGSPNKVELGDSQQKAFESLMCHLMNRPILPTTRHDKRFHSMGWRVRQKQ